MRFRHEPGAEVEAAVEAVAVGMAPLFCSRRPLWLARACVYIIAIAGFGGRRINRCLDHADFTCTFLPIPGRLLSDFHSM